MPRLLAATAGAGQPLPVPARTAVLAGLAEVLAKRAGARLRMVPASRAEARPRAPVVPPRPMARAGVRRGTRVGVVRRLRRVRVRTVAGRPARPAVTDHAGTLGRLPAAHPEAAGRPRVANIGAPAILRAEHLGAARVPEAVGPEAAGPPVVSRAWAEVPRAVITAAAPGLLTTLRLVLPLLARPAKAPASGPQRAADRVVRRRGVPAATLMRAATSVAAGGQRTPDHGGLPRVTQGAAQVVPGALRAMLVVARVTHGAARDPRAKGRRRALTAVTRRRDQPAAGPATAVRAILVEATTGQAVVTGQVPATKRVTVTGQVPATRPGPASGARTRPQPAVTAQAMNLGRMFRTRLALTSSTRKRGLS